MQVILLERIAKLGQMGDVVDVKPGYARNFLLPQGKAKSASEANIAAFESEKTKLEAHNLETRKEADALAEKLTGSLDLVEAVIIAPSIPILSVFAKIHGKGSIFPSS